MMMLIASFSGKVYSLRAQKTERNEKTKKVMKEIEKYSDITDDD